MCVCLNTTVIVSLVKKLVLSLDLMRVIFNVLKRMISMLNKLMLCCF